MEIFTVSFIRKCDFVGFIRARKDVEIRGMSERCIGEKSSVEIYSDKSIKNGLADVLTDYILGPYRRNIAEQYFLENYPYVSESEKQKIFRMLPFDAYAAEIRKAVSEYLAENESIDITGFVRFRLPAFARNTAADVNRAADSFLASKEFDEMVGLLKYHLKRTPAKGMLNIIFKSPSDFFATDENGGIIDLSDFTSADGSKKADLLVAIAVGLSPESIILHNEAFADPSAVHALRTVFEDKISVCGGCEICRMNKK